MVRAFSELQSQGHEQLCIFQRPEVGLTAIIAIHDSTLGPALGGCRMQQYDSFDEAVYDALRLAEGMTYKNSLAGLSIGGGKSVLIADRTMKQGRKELFLAFADCIESLNGRYITAEDMGTTVEDIGVLFTRTPHVAGKSPELGGGGDPAPHTARGVFDGIRACCERLRSTSNLAGVKVSIQGLGGVGLHLARLLVKEGVELVVADTRAERCRLAVDELGATVVDSEAIYSVETDVFSPCAVGATINQASIAQLACRVVAGAANNQLATPEDERRLKERGILYAPDFAINAGGVILCADESEEGGFTLSRVHERVAGIGKTVAKILSLSESSGKLAGQVAIDLAQERIAAAKAKRA